MTERIVGRAAGRRTWTAGIAMALGAMMLAACSETETTGLRTVDADATAALHANAPERGASTLLWNGIARELVVKHSTAAGPAIRVYALVSYAQVEAATKAQQSKEPGAHPSVSAAVAGASAAMLTYLYPAEASWLEAIVDSQETAAAGNQKPRQLFSAGEAIGRAIAAPLIEEAKTDGFFAPFTGTVPVCEACWLPVPTPPAGFGIGSARTFFLSSGGQFRPAPPPAFGSPAFLQDLAEVRRISDTRTAEQDSIAKFWSLQGGTVTPLGYWNVVAAELIARRNMDDRRAAHVFALVNLAGYDALVASHEAKYTYWLLRPTHADPAITLAIALPSFPSYPSNHAAISSAAATVLGAIFPRERKELVAEAEEAGISRVYGGIHYRFDSDAGLELGRKVGRLVLRTDRMGGGPLTR